MVNYYDIMRRGHPGQAPLWKSDLAQEETVIEPDAEASKALAPIAILSQARTPFEAARTRSLQALNERLAPLAGVGQSVRLLVTGCRPGDGASTVAMGLALDLSQRLSLRTLLVDAHLRKPELHKMFPPAGAKSPRPAAGRPIRRAPLQCAAPGIGKLPADDGWSDAAG